MKLLTPDPSPAEVTIPLFLHRASCGFPSPASDYLEGKLDLNPHCVAHPAATFYLRAEGGCCQRVLLFVRTSPFDERAPYYSEQAGVRLVCPSDDTRLLLQQVNVLLPQIWRDGYRYQKGGVMLSEFTPKGQQQADLFAPSSAQSDALMAVMDQIKAKGLGRVGFASQGTGSPEWMMRQEHLSPCYTTRWEDLPVAR
ncbi:TPA: DUF4113 domain-containing protein [Aeromonas veronii]